MHTSMRWSFTVLAAVFGCRNAANAPAISTDTAAAPPAATADTLPVLESPASPAALFSRIDSLEHTLATAPAADSARLLLRLAVLKRDLQDRIYQTESPEATRGFEQMLAQRTPDFFFNEIAGTYLYTGVELDTLLARFPQHGLADDAAWQQTRLVLGGECEGYIGCYLWSATRAHIALLERYPASPYADSALAVIMTSYDDLLSQAPDPTVASEFYDRAEVLALFAAYAAVAEALPGSLGASAREHVARVRARIGA